MGTNRRCAASKCAAKRGVTSPGTPLYLLSCAVLLTQTRAELRVVDRRSNLLLLLYKSCRACTTLADLQTTHGPGCPYPGMLMCSKIFMLAL